MELYQYIGFALAVVVGITLGLIGSGGSILSVPILVYILGVAPTLATAYSLFVVGTTALIGGLQKAKQQLVDFHKVLIFGIPTVITVFLTRKIIVPSIPEVVWTYNNVSRHKSALTMLVFAVVMIMASYRMIKPIKESTLQEDTRINYWAIGAQGIMIGLIAGFVGAGGGFLIIPALLFLAKTPMKMAVGTSLFIVSAQSLIGFLGDLGQQPINWQVLLSFAACSIVGVFIGNYISKKTSGEHLKSFFGWFVLLMGIYIITKELL